jgi:hypothetical protein
MSYIEYDVLRVAWICPSNFTYPFGPLMIREKGSTNEIDICKKRIIIFFKGTQKHRANLVDQPSEAQAQDNIKF